jgi:type I restriction enzyme S subunit
MMIIRPTAEGMYLYLYALLTSRQAKDRFEHMGYGAAVRQLSASQLSELPIPVPPPDLQREFASRIVVVEKLKAANRSSLAKLDALFSVLQHRAFRGEL